MTDAVWWHSGINVHFLDNHKQKGSKREKKAAAPPQNATGLVRSMALQRWWKVNKGKRRAVRTKHF